MHLNQTLQWQHLMALLVYNKAVFGWELRRTIPIPKEHFQSIVDRHALRQITISDVTYYYVPTKQYPKMMKKLEASATLLGKDIPHYRRLILVWTSHENPPETFEAFTKKGWFKELERES